MNYSSTVKRTSRMTPGWYQLGKTIIAQDGSVTFNAADLISIVSDAKRAGFRASAHAVSIAMGFSGTYSVGGADINTADIQRGCFYKLLMNTPNILSKYTTNAETLAFHRIVGRFINPSVVALDRLLPAKRQPFQRFDTPDDLVATQLAVNNPSVDKRISLVDGPGDDENWQKVVDTAGGPTFSFTDVFTVPLCNFSGGSRSFMNDKVPLTMLTDPNSPWRFTVSETRVNGQSIRGNHIASANVAVTVEVSVYISFAPVTSDHAVGVLWSAAPQPFSNSDKIIDSHYYRAFALMPDFASSTVDSIAVPYLPDNYANYLDTGNARIFDCSEQIFPLVQNSQAWRFIDHWNLGNSVAENFAMQFDQNNKANTVIVGPGSGIAGNVNPIYSNEARGAWSGVPIFPVIANHFAVSGFPINVMSKPGCTADIRVQFDGASLPTGAAQRAYGFYVAEYDADRNTLFNYSQYERQSGPGNASTNSSNWMPALENFDSAKAETAKDIVPYTLKV